jgi:hypothetical protein
MKARRLAFGNKARVGKDTAVNWLIEKYGGVKYSFAEAVYDIMYYAQKVCRFPQEKDRTFLQWIGTEWARAKDPDVWVNIVKEKIEGTNPNVSIYISDVRNPNEVEMLKKLGFTLVRITRKVDDIQGGSRQHSSETALDDIKWWDVHIENEGTLEEFYSKLDQL